MGWRSAGLLTAALIAQSGCGSGAAESPGGQRRQALPKVSPALPFEPLVYDTPAKGAYPSMAAGSYASLVAWRADEVGLLAAVVADNGSLLSPKPTSITKQPGGSAALGWNGSSFVVAWWAPNPDQITNALAIRRVGLDGALLDAAPITVAAGVWDPKRPALGCAASECLVAWTGASQGLRAARLNQDGLVQPPGSVMLSQSGAVEVDRTVAWDGASYIVAWTRFESSAYNLYGARVSGQTAVLDPEGKLLVSGLQQHPSFAVAAGSGQRFLAWTESAVPGTTSLRVSRLDASLELLDPGGIALPNVEKASSVSVAAEAGGVAVAWENTYDSIRTARISGGAPKSLALAQGSAPRLAARAFGSMATWLDEQQHLRFGSADYLEQGSKVVSLSPARQARPALASDGAGHGFAVWTDHRAGKPRVYGRHLDAEGKAAGASAIAIASWAHSPDVARTVGGSYLVAQVASDAVDVPGPIVGHFVDGPSVNLPISGDVIAKSAPRVACNLSACLTVWRDDRNGLTELFGARVTGAGILDPKGIDITLPALESIDSERFDVLAMGSHFLVLWAGGAARVGSDGVSSDFSSDDTKAVPLYWDSRPWSAAANGDRCLAVVNDATSSKNGTLVGPTRALLLGPSGERLEELVLDGTSEPDVLAETGVTWDGANFVVVTRGRAYRVSGAGKSIGEPVAVEELAEPALAPLDPSRIVHLGTRPDPLYATSRVFVQTLTRDTDSFPLGAGCATDVECASGACVQQICCASQCANGLACNPDGWVCTPSPSDAGTTEDGDADAGDVPDGAGSGSAKHGVAPDGGCACRAGSRDRDADWISWAVLAVLGLVAKERRSGARYTRTRAG